MKKLVLSLVIALGFIASASAQESGRMWIGGSLGFNHEKISQGDAEEKTTSFNILPEFGYFISDDLAIAGRLGYEHTKWERSGTETKQNAFIIEPFVRYTFLKGSIGAAFIDGAVRAKFGKESDENLFGIRVGITPGVLINVGNGFAVTAAFGHFGYSHEEVKFEPEKLKRDNIDLGFNFNEGRLGVIYSF